MSKIFLAYVARIHAGKDALCELIQAAMPAQQHGVIRFSDSLGRCLIRMREEMDGGEALPMNRQNYQWLSTILREEYDPNLLANRVRRSAIESSADVVHLMGMRKLVDVPMIRGLGTESQVSIIHVDAPQELRYQWICRSARKRGEKPSTWAEFVASDEQECEVEIDQIADQADYHILNTADDATFASLRSEAKHLMQGIRRLS